MAAGDDRRVDDGSGGVKASLFVTCVVDQVYPEVGESAARVLRRLGVDVDFPAAQTCCGQPVFNSGFWSDAKPLARRTVAAFEGAQYVVAPSGSCASMLRVFYDELFHDEPLMLQRVAALKPRVFELAEFVVDVLGIEDLSGYADAGVDAPSRKVTYHEACHLRRELGVKSQPRALIGSLPGVELVEMAQAEVCCGFGGTFSVKYPEISGAMLQDKIDFAAGSGADVITACDSSCLMHIGGGLEKQGVAVKPLQLASLIEEQLTGKAV